jgi:hypothetical protein
MTQMVFKTSELPEEEEREEEEGIFCVHGASKNNIHNFSKRLL